MILFLSSSIIFHSSFGFRKVEQIRGVIENGNILLLVELLLDINVLVDYASIVIRV